MDLEARTRELFDAMGNVQVERILALFADDGRYEVRGAVEPMDKAAYERYLRAVRRRMPEVRFQLEAVVVKRNVAFAEWKAAGRLADGQPFSNSGVHVLSWDQDGRLAHASVYTEPEKVKALVGPY